MVAPKIGFIFDTQELDSLVASSADFSVIGALVTAPAKDASLSFDTLYLRNSDDKAFYDLLGATGTARNTMDHIARQIGEMDRSARIVFNIIQTGADDKVTIANMVGSAASGTGVHKFKEAGQRLGVIPRLIIAPGYTSQFTKGGVTGVTITSGGSGYAAAPTVTFSAPASGTTATGTATITSGAVTSVTITDPGSGYTSAPTVTFSAPTTGTTAAGTAAIGNLANALCAEMPTVLDSLLATACIGGPSTSKQDAIDWRETLASKRLIPTDTAVLVADSAGNPVQKPNDAFIAGLINRVDELHGGLPFHTAASRGVYGIMGPARYTAFSLTDGDGEAQQLLHNDIGVIIRGEAGDDFAIAEGGFLYLGVGTCSNDPLWQFYNQVRGRDWIHLTLLRTLRAILGKHNLTNRTVKVYVNTIRKILSRLAAEERIHKDFKVELIPSLNTPDDLRTGKLTVSLAVEEPAPFILGEFKSRRYEYALTAFVEDLAAQLNQLAI
jgi:hypothetical protein